MCFVGAWVLSLPVEGDNDARGVCAPVLRIKSVVSDSCCGLHVWPRP